MQKLKENDDLIGCTFSPCTNSTRNKQKRYGSVVIDNETSHGPRGLDQFLTARTQSALLSPMSDFKNTFISIQ